MLGKKLWRKVALDDLSVIINANLHPKFEDLHQEAKETIYDNEGIDVRYSYTLEGVMHKSNMISLETSEDAISYLIDLCNKKNKFCYVKKDDPKVSFIFLPSKDQFNNVKWMVIKGELGKISVSLIFILCSILGMSVG